MKAESINAALEELEKINRELQVTDTLLRRRDLLDMGLIRESGETVYRAGSTDEDRQTLPFKKLHLPKAHIGLLEPNKAVDENHRALQILLPGTGTTFSTAETLCDVAGTFHGRKSRNRGRRREANPNILDQFDWHGKKFRVASFPTDLPLNGMGSDAPFDFASERGLMAVIRHAHLILSRLHPGRPVFISGRSQGGITAILYAQHHEDVAGVIAVNPPHPDPELFRFTVEYLEGKADVLSELLHAPDVHLHHRSWEAYKTFTPSFDYPSRKTLSPIMVMVSLGDPFNLFPQYAHALQAFAENDEKHHVHILDAGHNLWDRKSVDTYQKVILMQSRFILDQMNANPSVGT